MKLRYRYGGKTYTAELLARGAEFQALLGDKKIELRVLDNLGGQLDVEINGAPHQIAWARQGRKLWLHWNGRSYALEKTAGQGAGAVASARAESILRAPMPGQVRQVMAEAGQVVKAGDTLLLLEAMKMEIRIQAAHNAKVSRIAVKQGQTVEREQILVELEADDER